MIGPSTRLVFLAGDPIGHTKGYPEYAAAFAEAGIDAAYLPLHVPAGEFGAFLAGARHMRNLAGIVATIPHKQDAFAAARPNAAARRAGAANLLRPAPEGWEATNLDGIGMGVQNLVLGPMTLTGRVFIGGLMDLPDGLYFAGRLGGKLNGAGVEAHAAFTLEGPVGVCLDVNAGPAGIPLGPTGFLLTGAGGGLAFRPGIEPCDFAIFADTQEEPVWVEKQLAWLENLGSIPIVRVTAGKLGDDLINGRKSTGQRFAAIPAYTAFGDGQPAGQTRRQCTKEYKIEPIELWIRRELLELKPKQHMPKDLRILHYFGFSTDEPKRAARGLPTKKVQRRRLLFDALNGIAPIERSAVDLAYDTADAAFNLVWREQHVTWTIAQRLRIALQGLGRSLPDPIFDRVVADHQSMEIDIEPDLIDGCAEALAQLASRYSLAIVSDAIVTPGFRLCRL